MIEKIQGWPELERERKNSHGNIKELTVMIALTSSQDGVLANLTLSSLSILQPEKRGKRMGLVGGRKKTDHSISDLIHFYFKGIFKRLSLFEFIGISMEVCAKYCRVFEDQNYGIPLEL